MSTAVQIDPKSLRQLIANLQTLPKKVGLRVLRVALFAWGGVVKTEMQAKAKSGPSHLIPRSLTVDVTIPDASKNAAHHGKPPRVAVGPNRTFVGYAAAGKNLTLRKAQKRLTGGLKFRVHRPSRYAHFVERGIAGRSRVTPHPFVEPAARAGEGPGFQKFAQKMEQGIAAEASKLPKG